MTKVRLIKMITDSINLKIDMDNAVIAHSPEFILNFID